LKKQNAMYLKPKRKRKQNDGKPLLNAVHLGVAVK